MTREEQDAIIEATTVSYRINHFEMLGYWPAPEDNEASFRTALRLDDPELRRLRDEHDGPIPWSWQVARA